MLVAGMLTFKPSLAAQGLFDSLHHPLLVGKPGQELAGDVATGLVLLAIGFASGLIDCVVTSRPNSEMLTCLSSSISRTLPLL